MNHSKKFHILCIRFSSLGDIILHSSVVSALKERWGERIHISYLTSDSFVPLLKGHKDIDAVYGFSRESGIKGLLKLFALLRKIRAEREIDLIFDFHATLRSLAIRLRFLDIPRIFVDKRTVERWILTTWKFDLLSCQSLQNGERPRGFGELLLERNVRDFQSIFDYNYERERLSQHITGEVSENLQISSCAQLYSDDSNFSYPSSPYICLCPSASFPEKRWAVDKFYQLMQEICQLDQFIDFKIVILAGPQDDFCSQFKSLEDSYPGRILNLQGKTSLVETTFLTKRAYMVVGNDTGVPHIAESLGIPSVFILGPTGEQFGFYPHLKNSETVFKKLWCRPCTTNGKGNCIRSERYCLTTISVKDVIDKILIVDKNIKETRTEK